MSSQHIKTSFIVLTRTTIIVLITIVCTFGLIMLIPGQMLRCEVVIERKVARLQPYKPGGKLGYVKEVDVSEEYIGIGKISGSGMVCVVRTDGRV